jgi:cytochrome c biogenesis protein
MKQINLKNPLTFLEIISSTGLQIKTDPGIPFIYFGFFLLMLSTLISYITYSQIWIIQKDQKFLLVVHTNRAIFDFELEFFKFIK